jgi:ABC-2 type transport system ATP-binding protein
VGIAQAIVHDPPAIILDEPTVGLDPRQIIDVRNLIKSLAGSHTIILSTHILPEVSMTCNRVAIINKGKVVATNTPETLMSQLTGGSGYELEIGGETNLAKQVLQQLPDVSLVESIPTVAANGMPLPQNRACLRVLTQPGSEPGSNIAAILLQADFQLYEMRRVSATLEDVFLQLTTEEKKLETTETAETTEGEV